MTHLSLSLVGFGHVGRAFARLLIDSQQMLADRYALECTVVGIATRRHGIAINKLGIDLEAALAIEHGSLASLHCCPDVPDTLAFIRDSEPDVLVEASVLDAATGGPAVDHIRAALAGGAHVVTANKGPIACAYRELRDLARLHGRALRFESTVMDGTPVFNLVERALPGCTILGFRGVINSTTNVILSAMEDGASFEDALSSARAMGIVEADEASDVDGLDAAAKTAALVNVLMDGGITPREVATRGIRDVTGEAVRAAVSRNRRIRLVASARRDAGAIVAAVAPASLPGDDLLATLRGSSNALVLHTDFMDDVTIVEHEGGVRQTAYGLLSDVIAIAQLRF